MKTFNTGNPSEFNLQEISTNIKNGAIGVIPTDTIYGIVGSALDKDTVERIYSLRKRTPSKPMIVLIAGLDDLKKFNVQIDEKIQELLQKIWPNPVSVILPCLSAEALAKEDQEFEYLHRGTNTLAFRMPNDEFLQKLLPLTGPLVAPSANFEGEPPALTIQEAQKYFGENVEFYADAGKLESSPSTVIKIENGKLEVVREGKYVLNNSLIFNL